MAKMWLVIMLTPALLAAAVPVPVHAMQVLESEAVLVVEPGDSYLGLFGADWPQVLAANQDLAFRDHRGRLLPDKLVAGARIRVPAGTRVADAVLARLDRLRAVVEAAQDAINQAEGGVEWCQGASSPFCEDGLALLAQARAAAAGNEQAGPDPGAAKRLAEEAVHAFVTARLDAERVAAHQHVAEVERQQQTFILGAALLLAGLAAVALLSRHRYRRRLRAVAWLTGHQLRLEKLVNIKI